MTQLPMATLPSLHPDSTTLSASVSVNLCLPIYVLSLRQSIAVYTTIQQPLTTLTQRRTMRTTFHPGGRSVVRAWLHRVTGVHVCYASRRAPVAVRLSPPRVQTVHPIALDPSRSANPHAVVLLPADLAVRAHNSREGLLRLGSLACATC